MGNCQQTKCSFHNTLSCPYCDECESGSCIVDDNCTSCHNCQFDEGYIRGNSQKNKEKPEGTKQMVIIKNG